jgi:hypothetical protein
MPVTYLPDGRLQRPGSPTKWSLTSLTAVLATGLVAAGCTGAVGGDQGRGPGPGTVGPGGSGSSGSGSNGSGSSGSGSNGSGSNGSGSNGSGSGGGTTPTPVPVMPSASLDVAASGLRRLTAEQYRNTVRDLLQMPAALELVPVGSLPADGSLGERFSSNVASVVSGQDGDKYADAADALAKKAAENLTNLVPCPPASGNADCATRFIEGFGRKAFRRPLNQTEVTRYKTVFAAGADFTNGIRLVISAFLQSPKFLYLVEVVPPDGAGKVLELDAWAVASRLSYFLLNSMPDDQLFAAAESGSLKNPDEIGKQVTRLLSDERFKETVNYFHDQWVELELLRSAEKEPALFPAWTPALKTAQEQQIRRFIQGVLFEGDGRIETLLTANFSYLSGPLYALYGKTPPAGAAANAWTKVDLDPKERIGLLTHPGIMAAMAHEDRTSFILRGKLVREALLCTPMPPPPPGVDASETNIDPKLSAQERAMQHRKDPSCASCHANFDPLGFAFEIYDGAGKFRTTDAGGKAIDSRAEITGTSVDGPATDALDLMRKLGPTKDVRNCVAQQWLRFALGRDLDDKEDASTLQTVFKSLDDSNGKVPDMLGAIARSNAFRHLKVK